MDWYAEYIEEGVRDIVRLLRDNGFNTTCSCHHDMIVEGHYLPDGEPQRLHRLLVDSGYRNYELEFRVVVHEGWPTGFMTLKLPKEEKKQ